MCKVMVKMGQKINANQKGKLSLKERNERIARNRFVNNMCITSRNVCCEYVFVVFQSKPKNEQVCLLFVFHSVFPLSLGIFLSIQCDTRWAGEHLHTRSYSNLIALQCFTHPLIWYAFNANLNVEKQWKITSIEETIFNPFSKESFCLTFQYIYAQPKPHICLQ